MKYLISLGTFITFTLSICCQSQTEVVQAASHWIQENFTRYPSTIRSINTQTDASGNICLYEIVTDSLCILMSGHKASLPVLAYYKEPLLEEFGQASLPCNLQSFIGDYMMYIEQCFSEGIAPYYAEEWDNLIAGTSVQIPVFTSSAGPLLSTIWGQSDPNHGSDNDAYNYYCPGDGTNCEHCLAGCVAVAMAQVMNYWKSPLVSKSIEHQFDWCNMHNSLTSGTPQYETQRNAIAYLLYKCGTLLNMDYGCGGSGARTQDVPDVLTDYFEYSGDAQYKKRTTMSDEEWMQKLKGHIDWGFPVIYSGHSDTSGHAFVCDGYDNRGYFHFNWGWCGNSDGYYSIYQMTPPTHNYYKKHSAVFYIHPESETHLCEFALELSNYYQGNVYLEFFQAYEIVPSTMAQLISASASSPASWRTIPSSATVAYQAHKEIVLQDGFTVERGADFTAEIVPCPNCEEEDSPVWPLNPIFDSLPIIHDDGTVAECVGLSEESFIGDAYPNPTSGPVTIATDGMAENIVVYTLAGQPVGGWQLMSLTDEAASLDLSPLRSGTYLIAIGTDKGTVRTVQVLKK